MKDKDIQAAAAMVEQLQREAAGRKRAAGEARNPFKANPGQGREFEAAGERLRACRLILRLLEKERLRRARRQAGSRLRRAILRK